MVFLSFGLPLCGPLAHRYRKIPSLSERNLPCLIINSKRIKSRSAAVNLSDIAVINRLVNFVCWLVQEFRSFAFSCHASPCSIVQDCPRQCSPFFGALSLRFGDLGT